MAKGKKGAFVVHGAEEKRTHRKASKRKATRKHTSRKRMKK